MINDVLCIGERKCEFDARINLGTLESHGLCVQFPSSYRNVLYERTPGRSRIICSRPFKSDLRLYFDLYLDLGSIQSDNLTVFCKIEIDWFIFLLSCLLTSYSERSVERSPSKWLSTDLQLHRLLVRRLKFCLSWNYSLRYLWQELSPSQDFNYQKLLNIEMVSKSKEYQNWIKS